MTEARPLDEAPTTITPPIDFAKTGPAHAVGAQRPVAPAPPAPAAPFPAGAPGAPAAAPAQKPPNIELIVCPECGTTAMVTLNRRESTDFCRNCDYPLFWTPSAVMRDRDSDTSAESLRRLPGTVGRATIASLTCPHCSEPNAVTATVCVRCGQPLHLVDAPPPPAPVYIPPPPRVEVVPEKSVTWWVWALLIVGLAAVVTMIILITTHTIGS